MEPHIFEIVIGIISTLATIAGILFWNKLSNMHEDIKASQTKATCLAYREGDALERENLRKGIENHESRLNEVGA